MKNPLFVVLILVTSWSHFAFAKAAPRLSDQQAIQCIQGDRTTQSAFQDLQAAYEMRLITAKDFFQVMDRSANCPQLRKDLKKLQASAIAQFPPPKPGGLARPRGNSGESGGLTAVPQAPAMPSPPPVDMTGFPPFHDDMPDSEFFDDEFDVQ